MLSQLDRDWILFRIRRLSGAQFEDLCRDLLSAEGHQDIQHFGAAGSEKGVDILSRTPDGRWLVTQCKQVASLGPKPAGEELQKVIDNPINPPVQAFRIAAPINYTRATREKLQEIGGKDLEIEPAWDGPVLLDLLEKYQAIRDDRIGFIPSEAEIRKTLPFWNVPRRNDYFTGREDLLDELERRLEDEGSTALTQTITGLGGIGKTQVAIEYCHRHRLAFDGGVFWLDASSAESLIAGYAELAVDLEKVGRDVPTEDAARAFLQHLAQTNGWLVVLDNADEPDAIRPLLPPTTGGQVLITTRAQKPGLGKARPLPVDVWPADQATDFLLERADRHDDERKDAELLAQALDGLPLALEQAGAFLEHHDLAIGEYLEAFRRLKLKLFNLQRPEEGNYEETVATTWEISFQKIEEASEAAAEALETCAFLAPQGIPIELFTRTGSFLGPSLASLVRKESNFEFSMQLIEPLSRYSLVIFDKKNQEFSLHRLVQRAIQLHLVGTDGRGGEGRIIELFQGLAGSLDFHLPPDSQESSDWKVAARWIPHIMAISSNWPRDVDLDPTALWGRAGAVAWSAGRFKEAIYLNRKCVAFSEERLGSKHPDTLIAVNNLGSAYWSLGDFERSRSIFLRVVNAAKESLSPENSILVASMHNLASVLAALGDYKNAAEYSKQVLEIRSTTLGPRHPDTLRSINNFAELLRSTNRESEAREAHAAVLEGRRLTLGENHPETLQSLINLAESHRRLGDFEQARSVGAYASALCKEVLGDKHPTTLCARSNFAEALGSLGKRKLAMAIHKDVLRARLEVLGDEHPETLISMHNLCCIQASDSLDGQPEKELLNRLLVCIAKLPQSNPVRIDAEARWLPKSPQPDKSY